MKTEPTLIIRTLTGSRIYNLHTEDSDYDWRMVQISPLRYVISPFRDPNTTSKANEERDDTTWELRHFVKHATKGNPSILEVVYSPSRFYEVLHPAAKLLLDNRRRLLDNRAIYDAHRGYATAQVKKLATATRVQNGAQETEYTVDRELRRRKATVAYFRILAQGAQLLKDGDFDTWLPNDNSFRALLFEIKQGTRELSEHEFQSLSDTYERALTASYESAPTRAVDYKWIEEYLEQIYVSYGLEEEASA